MFSILKVALLDDEKFVRDGLARLLTSDSITIAGSYYNGYHLIDDLKNKLVSPNIIIADIRMPEINGLDFIRAVRQSHPNIYLVILSGYGEFEYAKQAIENQVYRYLLKPLDERELFQCLRDIELEINAEKEHANWKEYSFDLMFHSAVNGQPIQHLPFFEKPKFTRMLYFYYKTGHEEIKNELLSLCEKWAWNGRIFEVDDNHLLFLLFSFNEDISKDVFKALESLCNKKSIYAGVSGSYQNFSFMPQMYKEAKKAIGHKIFSSKPLHFYSDIDYGSMSVNHNKCNELITSICLANENDIALNTKKLTKLIKPNPGMLITFSHLSKLLKQYALTLSEEFSDPLLKKAKALHHFEIFDSSEEYKAFFVETIDCFLQATNRSIDKDLGIKLNKAVSFIQNNYNRELSLEEVAAAINLSANYFSNLFRQKMGVGFIEYITDIRLQKAKELLANTNYKVYEISRIVGFNEPKYFIRTFKKFWGMSPTTYRSHALQLNQMRDRDP